MYRQRAFRSKSKGNLMENLWNCGEKRWNRVENLRTSKEKECTVFYWDLSYFLDGGSHLLHISYSLQLRYRCAMGAYFGLCSTTLAQFSIGICRISSMGGILQTGFESSLLLHISYSVQLRCRCAMDAYVM
jgi:hypothetical protein